LLPHIGSGLTKRRLFQRKNSRLGKGDFAGYGFRSRLDSGIRHARHNGMPRQKLTRKQPKLHGKQGQVQPSGPHDPEHQEGPIGNDKADSRGFKAGTKAANPRVANKQSPL